ncbi:MAG: chondroitinase-B domain-containing protein, partial [Planctomycetota bacterium]
MNHMRSHLVVSSTFVAVFLAALVPCAKFARAEMRTADSPDGFTRAVGAAQPGDEIVIPNGRYSNWNVVLNCSGTEEQPIIVRAEDAHEVVFTEKASFRITGKHIVIRGLAFQDLDLETSPIRLANAQSCRVTECRFTGLQGSAAVVHFEGPAAHNRVDHCKFMQIKTRSVQLRIREDSLKEGPPLSNRIDHNLFQDVPRKGSNGRETIQIGSDQKAYGHIEPKTLV